MRRQNTLLVRVWIPLLSTYKPAEQLQQNLNERCATGSHPNCIHTAACLTTGPVPLPKQVLYIVQSSVSTRNFQYHVFP